MTLVTALPCTQVTGRLLLFLTILPLQGKKVDAVLAKKLKKKKTYLVIFINSAKIPGNNGAPAAQGRSCVLQIGPIGADTAAPSAPQRCSHSTAAQQRSSDQNPTET